ncbi:MAG: phosphatidylglycerophosphatase A [Planctomycetia bacterium]|nr:MAG: phosphatidylglycerophosphatase A [Planctomycetia bacterium]
MSRRGADLLRTACVTVLGSGFAPFASGTWGSLAAAAMLIGAVAMVRGGGGGDGAVQVVIAVGVLAACWASVAFGPWAVARFGRKDPKPFVLDEFAGQWLAMLALPGAALLSVGWLTQLGFQFVLFRALDVWKPAPGRQLERLPHGWGILLDDLSSAVYANLIAQAAWRVPALSTWLAQNSQPIYP